MAIPEWLKRVVGVRSGNAPQKKNTPDQTPPIPSEGMAQAFLRRPLGDEDEIHLYENDEERKAFLRKTCKAVEYMTSGVIFCCLETRDDKFTYEVYKATSSSSALHFLRAIPCSIIPPLYYITVEASGAKLGKDKEGIFDETTGATLE